MFERFKHSNPQTFKRGEDGKPLYIAVAYRLALCPA